MTIEWHIAKKPIAYPEAVAEMEAHVAKIHNGTAKERVWLLEHPPLYTAGTSADEKDLLTPEKFPVYQTGRGGQYTYHGPGQRVCYVMLDLKNYGQDVRNYIQQLEQWIINSLTALSIKGERREGRVGIWVDQAPYGGRAGQEDKIAAIGVRLRKWISYHGIALNIDPDLSHFSGIVPCGIAQHGVTSLHKLGFLLTMEEVDIILRDEFEKIFGQTELTS